MGRAGGGGRSGGGHHSSHSSHSMSRSSRSSSSHSFSRPSSSRSGSSSFSGSSGRSGSMSRPSSSPSRPSIYNPTPPRGPGYTPPPPRPRTTVYHNTTYVNNGPSVVGGYGGRDAEAADLYRRNRALKTWVIILAVLTCIFLLMFITRPSGSGTVNTTNREKLELGYGYPNDTLTDQLDWIKDPGRLNRNLKNFYDTTGVIPYVALLNEPSVYAQGESAEEAFANQWYEDHFSNEGYLLLVYFSSGQEDYGTDGDCQLICGEQVGVLMDAEAQNIFWEYLDRYWFSDVDEDTLFANTFNKTADRIMQRQTTGMDVAKAFFLVMAIGCGVSGVVCIMLLKRKHEAERAAETAEILSKPLRPTGESSHTSEEDELLDKYGSSED